MHSCGVYTIDWEQDRNTTGRQVPSVHAKWSGCLGVVGDASFPKKKKTKTKLTLWFFILFEFVTLASKHCKTHWTIHFRWTCQRLEVWQAIKRRLIPWLSLWRRSPHYPLLQNPQITNQSHPWHSKPLCCLYAVSALTVCMSSRNQLLLLPSVPHKFVPVATRVPWLTTSERIR